MENHHFVAGKINYFYGPFSIAMLNYQRYDFFYMDIQSLEIGKLEIPSKQMMKMMNMIKTMNIYNL